MSLAGRIRARSLAAEIEARARLLDENEPGAQEREQLARLNAAWSLASEQVPHWRVLRRERGLPASFDSLPDFCASVPPTTRALVQGGVERLRVEGARAERMLVTGGSSAQPVALPAWHRELSATSPDRWVARGWYGVRPDARSFLLWGHGHLLGTGWRARIAGARRELQDRLLGYRRFPAYDLRPEALRRAADALLDFAPQLVVGYSVALDLLARANRDRAPELARLGIGAVVATAESFPAPDSAERVRAVLGAPVAMEYGSVETDIVAHTHPEGGYRVFWRSYLLEAERGPGGRHAVRVTSLYPRCLPLVRYELGDEIELAADAPRHAVGVTRFERVIGRCNDYVPLADGALIHSEAFSHALRSCAELRAFQVVFGPRGLRIRYTADDELSSASVTEIRERLHRIHPGLASAALERVERIPQTVAGKTRMVVAEASGGA